mgnify:CR=1 FL=1
MEAEVTTITAMEEEATGMEDMGMTIMDMGTEAMGMEEEAMAMEEEAMAMTTTDTDTEEEVTRYNLEKTIWDRMKTYYIQSKR